MIFDSNQTNLGNYEGTIPMAEGYDCEIGVAVALIESAKNDLAIFKSMLECDAMELAESKGFVQEAEVKATIKEAGKKAWERISGLLEKLVAKVKSIYNSLTIQLEKVLSTDKAFVKKYEKDVRAKDLSKMEGKFAAIKDSPTFGNSADDLTKVKGLTEIGSKYSEKKDDMVKAFLGGKDKKAYAEDFHNKCFGEEKTGAFGSSGLTIDEVIKYLTGASNVVASIKKQVNSFEKTVAAMVKQAKSNAKAASKEDTEQASKVAAAASAYNEASLWITRCLLNEIKYEHKLCKATFAKAVSYKPSASLPAVRESAEDYDFADILTEAETEDAVTSAIALALGKEDISDVSDAKKDDGTPEGSTDPNHNTYDKTDCYSQDETEPKVDGTVKTCINSKCESVDFGELLC